MHLQTPKMLNIRLPVQVAVIGLIWKCDLGLWGTFILMSSSFSYNLPSQFLDLHLKQCRPFYLSLEFRRWETLIGQLLTKILDIIGSHSWMRMTSRNKIHFADWYLNYG